MPSQEGSGSKTTRSESTRNPELNALQEISPPDLTTKNESAHDFLEEQDNDKSLLISLDKINLSDNDATEGDDIDQPGPSRCSTRISKPIMSFNPGIGLDRNWSLDMVVNKTLILNNYACKLSDDDV
eukprot:15349028-Ditylum_brightwellii.AAC.2